MAGAKKPSQKPKKAAYNSGPLKVPKVPGPPDPHAKAGAGSAVGRSMAGMAKGGVRGAGMGTKAGQAAVAGSYAKLAALSASKSPKAGGMSKPSSQRIQVPKPVGGKRVSPPQRKR